jgi:hypothetical protein
MAIGLALRKNDSLFARMGSEMKWDVTLNKEGHFAEVVTHGASDRNSSLEMITGLNAILRDNKMDKVLIDNSDLEAVIGTFSEIYGRPKEFQDIGVIPTINIAEIIKPEQEEHFKLLKLVLKTRGINISIFYNKETALKWLLKY